MSIKEKLDLIQRLIDEIRNEVGIPHTTSTPIKKFYSSYVHIRKIDFRFERVLFEILNGPRRQFQIYPEMTKQDLIRKIKNDISSLYAKPVEIEVFISNFLMNPRKREFTLEAFILMPNPDITFKSYPKFRVILMSEDNKRPSVYGPLSWENGLYCGNSLPYEKAVELIKNMDQIDGFHFHEAKYTKEQFKELGRLLKNKDIINPIWDKRMK